MLRCLALTCLVFLFLVTAPVRGAESSAQTSSVVSSGDAFITSGADFDADFGDDFSGGSVPERLISDPLELFNRGVFWVNDKLYFYALKPVAKGYRLVIPRTARVSVGNFFSNLAAPIRVGNALLQLKFRDFGTEVYRFVINTTFGIAGLFDPAESVAGVRPVNEDFGQTLGPTVWGMVFISFCRSSGRQACVMASEVLSIPLPILSGMRILKRWSSLVLICLR